MYLIMYLHHITKSAVVGSIHRAHVLSISMASAMLATTFLDVDIGIPCRDSYSCGHLELESLHPHYRAIAVSSVM